MPEHTPFFTPPADPEPEPKPSIEPTIDPPVEPASEAAPEAWVAPVAPVAPSKPRSRFGLVHVALILVVLIAGSGLFAGGYTLGVRAGTTAGTPGDLQSAFAPFWEVWNAINTQYVGKTPVDQKKLVEGAIDGLIGSLGDPYSSYMTPEEYKATLESLSGQFGGIGASIGTKTETGADASCTPLSATCRMVIVEPLEGAPAAKAGLQAGDRVTAIDGTTVDGLTLDQATAKVRGEKGTTVTLTLVRGTAAPFDLTITRDTIVQKEVKSKTLANGSVEYIQVLQFSDSAATDFQAAVETATKAGIKRFVIDLRNNPGGYVTAAQKIASQFIGSGPIYFQEDAKGTRQEVDATSGGLATDASFQVLVLVNKGSASASEIVSGALQDTGRAKLVGETTYGKGVIQEWHQLEGDNGGFRLTVAKWLTPNGRWIQGTGLTPDVVVTVPDGTPADQDPVLDKALTLFSGTANAGAGNDPFLKAAA